MKRTIAGDRSQTAFWNDYTPLYPKNCHLLRVTSKRLTRQDGRDAPCGQFHGWWLG